MRTISQAVDADDLDDIEREMEQVLIPLRVSDSFTERLRSGLMAAAPGQWSLVRSRPRHHWGLILAVLGGALSALWLVVWLARREHRTAG